MACKGSGVRVPQLLLIAAGQRLAVHGSRSVGSDLSANWGAIKAVAQWRAGGTARQVIRRIRDVANTAAKVHQVTSPRARFRADELVELRRVREQIEQQLDIVTTKAGQIAERLVKSGWSYRDTGTAVGLSHQRLAQLVKERRPARS
jgi:hypothetical protein